jgi:hypothetical protein
MNTVGLWVRYWAPPIAIVLLGLFALVKIVQWFVAI